MNKWIVLLFVFEVACGYTPNRNEFKVLDSIRDEQPCLSAGGRCVVAADCPSEGRLEQRGLCPAQQAKGVECCYGVSIKETRCRGFGGTCSDTCPVTLTRTQAKDCPADQECCVLV
ncbi:hypothetical protein JYU34_011518 [Plutella xylostella]|uniref:Uncharacterized protein n=1 Tax=Plutella xylostella TaxID=51655 RepID=A0ABQ7QH68_PLUXY|nr:hypothetical protein JYU34_011518 [Plutella xylostella]